MKTPAGKALDLAILFGEPKGKKKRMASDADDSEDMEAEEGEELTSDEPEELTSELKAAAEEAFPDMVDDEDRMKALARFVRACAVEEY